MLADSNAMHDTIIFISYMACDKELNCSITDYQTYSGMQLGLDQFIVNSFMFIPGFPLFVVSADNYGLIIIDMISRTMVDMIPLNSLVPIGNRFIIHSIVPLHGRGMRVYLSGSGSLSLLWDSIGVVGDTEHILQGLRMGDGFIAIQDEVTTNIMDYNDSGIFQLVYYRRGANFFDAAVRIHNHMHPSLSKMYREYQVGRVRRCIYIHRIDEDRNVVLVCDTKIFHIDTTRYPILEIPNDSKNQTIDIEIVGTNRFSNQTISLRMSNISIEVEMNKFLVMLTFLSIIMTCLTIVGLMTQ